MNRSLPKTFKLWLLIVACIAGIGQTKAQYTVTTLETGHNISGLTKDAAGNIYVVRSGATTYEVAKYTNGDPAAVQVIYSGLVAAAPDAPWGIAVNAAGDVFVTNPVPDVPQVKGWQIIKLAAPSYAPTVIQQDKFYTALAIDGSNNLLSMEYNSAANTYQIVRYAAGNLTGAGTVVWNGLAVPDPPDGSYPWGMAMDASNNIYITDFYRTTQGAVIKLTAPGYSPTTLATGRYYSALAIDGSNNLYVSESVTGTGVPAHIMKYNSLMQGGTEVAAGLGYGGFIAPWGLTVSNGIIYAGDGANIRALKITPSAPAPASVVASSILDASPTKANTVRYSITFDKAVSGVTTSSFSVSGVTGASVISAFGGPTTFTVTANTGTGNGTLKFGLLGNAVNGITPTISNAPYNSLVGYTVDKTAPTVDHVVPPANATYKDGDVLSFQVVFSENIVIAGGTPAMDLVIGSTTHKVPMASATGNTATFNYQLASPDMDNDGIQLGSLSLNGSTITDLAGNNANLTLNGVPATSGILVNTSHITVNINSTVSSLYNMPFTATTVFSEAVTGFTVGDITAGNATVSSLNTSDNITYTFLVTPVSDGPVNIQVPAGVATNISGNGNSASNTFSMFYDHNPPELTSISLPNGAYKLGDVLTFTAQSNEILNVAGSPYLSFNVGSSPVHAALVGSDGSATPTFQYTVKAGDFDYDGGIVLTSTTINMNGGVMHDIAGNALNPNLPAGSLSFSGVTIDGVAPTFTSVSVPPNGYYKAGDALTFLLQPSEGIGITGHLTLNINIGGVIVPLEFAGGGSTMRFSYTVQPGDNDMDGIELIGLSLNGGTIQDLAGNNMDLTLTGTPSTSGIFVNTTIPSVVLSKTVGAQVNAPFTITSTFSEKVTGLIASDFAITNAAVSNINTADGITYTALVTPTSDGPVSVTLPANAAVNTGGNANSASNTLNVTYDGTAPVITTVGAMPVGTYKAGDILSYTLTFSENITVTGNPTLDVVMTSGTGQAKLMVIDPMHLTFEYVIQPGDLDADGVAPGASVQLNGATIRDAAGNNANLVLAGISPNIVKVDAVSPTVISVTAPPNKTYKTGDLVPFQVQFSENVIITGNPLFIITVGSYPLPAMYTSGSGTSSIGFLYTVQPGEEDLDGIEITSLATNGGSIKDAVGNNAVLTLNSASVPGTAGILIDAIAPAVQLTGPSSGNGAFTATITFSEKVNGLTTGDFDVVNGGLSGLTTTDNITYTMNVTPLSDGPVEVTLPAATVTDPAGNPNTASNTLSYTADLTPPTVTFAAVPVDAVYNAGMLLHFNVAFDEVVTVNTTGGTPSLPVTIGGTTVDVPYVSGSGTSTLTFNYTVQDGDMDMDGITLAGSLALNGSAITDNAGNNANLTLNHVPGTTNVRVNTEHPSVTISTAAPARVNAQFNVTISFSEAVSDFTAADVVVTNGIAGTPQSIDAITFTVPVTPNADGAISIDVPADGAVNIGNNGNTASNTLSVTADLTAPVITNGQQFSILANSAVGTTVNTAAATDGSGIIQSWTILADPSGGAFAIDASTGVITVNNISLLNNQSGHTVTLIVTVSDGLNTSVATPVEIEVLPLNLAPTLDVINNAAVCTGAGTQTMQVTGASAVEPTQTYTLSVAADQPYFDVLTVTHTGVLSYKLKSSVAAGQAVITVTIQDNGGTANGGVDKTQQSFTLTINPVPVVTITSDKGSTVSKGDVVHLTATGGDTYNWDNAAGIVSGQQTAVLEIRPQANATYAVTVTSAAGCSSTASINIAIVEDFKVDATNIVTPNGDGKNDRWVIHNIDSYPNNEVKIFDRAGRLVYQRRNYNNEWDGTLNGNPLAEGTYYYILTISGGKTAKGAITIIRDRY